MASAAAASGPVATLINKRIRNLRKKLKRIDQLEESITRGKSVIKNSDQEELLKSKPTIVAAINELEKFREPLSAAVDEEINRAIEASENIIGKELDDHGYHNSLANKTLEKEQNPKIDDHLLVLEDLLSLIYLGNMFDLKSQNDFNSIILTRKQERNSCLMYDMLGEKDLDMISMMGSLLISRPKNSNFSHQNALQRCIQHAKLWLSKSEQPIDSNSSVTYASLIEKLAKITESDFLTTTPEIKATADVAADVDSEAAGSYNFQVPAQVESSVPSHVFESKKNYKMPGSLCQDLVFEIFTRLPCKSLLRFRSLSKLLSSYIDSPDFIRMHTFRSPEKILIQHKFYKYGIPEFYTLHMEDQLPTDHTGYKGINRIDPPYSRYSQCVIGSCNGIICLVDDGNGITLWNPSIGCKLSLPDCRGRCTSLRPRECSCGAHKPTAIGFGFDPITDDYKIVRLPKCGGKGVSSYVYTMKTGAWCEITSPIPSFFKVTSRGCFLNGKLYWVVQSRIPESGDVNEYYILTFNLSTYVFRTIELPRPRWETKQLMIIHGSLTVISSGVADSCVSVKMNKYFDIDYLSVLYDYEEEELERVLQPTSNSDLLLFKTEKGGFQVYDHKTGSESRLRNYNGGFQVYDHKIGSESRLQNQAFNYIAEIETYVESLQLLHMGTACQPSVFKEKKKSKIQLKNSFKNLPSD